MITMGLRGDSPERYTQKPKPDSFVDHVYQREKPPDVNIDQ